VRRPQDSKIDPSPAFTSLAAFETAPVANRFPQALAGCFEVVMRSAAKFPETFSLESGEKRK